MVKKIIKKIIGKKISYKLIELIYVSNLTRLAQLYNTDKFGKHNYTPIYNNYFNQIRKNKNNILEIGVGGYNEKGRGGASLKMWKTYFRNSLIYGIDIYDKSELEQKRIKIFKGSQIDKYFLEEVVSIIGEIDIIIDDGSHINNHVITTFKYLFKELNKGGLYFIEDTQTSYWEDYGGCDTDLNKINTIMNFFKNIVDSVNIKEFNPKIIKGVEKIYDDIEYIHFYHNLIVIKKING